MSSLVKNVHSYNNNIIPFDFEKVNQIPVSQVYTSDHPIADPTLIPIVDLEDPNAVNLVRQACEEWGVFYITNHGVPMSLFHEMEYQTRRLFQLPTEDKIRALRLPGDICGYGTTLVAENCSKQTWSEVFTLKGPPFVQARKLWSHDQDHNQFCAVAEKYQLQMERVRKQLMGVLLSSLDLAYQDIDWLGHTNNESQILHLNSYPICPDPSKAIGLLPHTDSPLITLLHHGNIAGLQVLRDNIGWMPVQPLNGALTVILGDMMHILTNGRFKNPLHRVTVNNLHHRISVVYFYHPTKGVKVSPLAKLMKDEEGPMYRSVTWEELLEIKRIHLKDPMKAIRL